MCSNTKTLKTESYPPFSAVVGGRKKAISVNLVLSDRCNYRCKFCFAKFDVNRYVFSQERILEIPRRLSEMGTSKLTIEGGEPFLHPRILKELLKEAKKNGITTMVISNGSLITREFLEEISPHMDWLGLSLDSPNEKTELVLGRGYGNHVEKIIEVAKWCHELGIRLKINAVITRYNVNEDMNEILIRLRPERVKFFQYLHIKGSNDEHSEELKISDEEFEEFVRRHKKLERYGIDVAAERNEDMKGSYLMLMPDGRFFNNNDGRYHFTEHSVFEDPEKAFEEARWDEEKFVKRKGLYDWKGKERK